MRLPFYTSQAHLRLIMVAPFSNHGPHALIHIYTAAHLRCRFHLLVQPPICGSRCLA